MDKRQAIFKATLDLVYEQGFHATPVSQIADRANVGAGSVYRYFKNKDDLLNQLYLEVKMRMYEAARKGLESDMPFEAMFKRVWLNLFEFDVSHPHEFTFAEQNCSSQMLTKETREAGERVFHEFCEIVEKAMNDGIINDLPREIFSAILIGTINALVKKQLSGSLDMTDDLRKKAAHAAWCAIRR